MVFRVEKRCRATDSDVKTGASGDGVAFLSASHYASNSNRSRDVQMPRELESTLVEDHDEG